MELAADLLGPHASGTRKEREVGGRFLRLGRFADRSRILFGRGDCSLKSGYCVHGRGGCGVPATSLIVAGVKHGRREERNATNLVLSIT
jgi:hypothetical protein